MFSVVIIIKVPYHVLLLPLTECTLIEAVDICITVNFLSYYKIFVLKPKYEWNGEYLDLCHVVEFKRRASLTYPNNETGSESVVED